MKIVQVVSNLNWGDAIGNDILAIDSALRQEGFSCQIMAVTIHEKLADRARPVDFSILATEDLILFHKASGDALTAPVARLSCKKVLVYHNITPAKYFLPYDWVMSWNLRRGRNQLKKYAPRMDFGWGDSQYNRNELIASGMPEEKTAVLPILFEPGKVAALPDEATAVRLRQRPGSVLLFIGRVAPHKKFEDVIKVFWYYLRNEDPQAVLYLIGGWQGLEKYYAKLRGFVADLGLTEDQVVFTGQVSDEVRNVCLRCADALVCMSEHEGFCVPLLEAMRSDLPIVAFRAAAVPETLGDNGLVFDRKDYPAIAAQIGRLRRDDAFRAEVIRRQRERLLHFSEEAAREKLLALVRQAAGGIGG